MDHPGSLVRKGRDNPQPLPERHAPSEVEGEKSIRRPQAEESGEGETMMCERGYNFARPTFDPHSLCYAKASQSDLSLKGRG